MKKGLMIVLWLFIAATGWSQTAVKWYTIDEALKLNKTKPKKLLVDIYTDWCGWCKKMDKDTYADTAIARYINDNFYAVKFNAEQRGPVMYNGKQYNFVSQGARGYHEFAAAMFNGQSMGYPATGFFGQDSNFLILISGYQGPLDMEALLHYFTEEIYKTGVGIQTYSAKYQKQKKSQNYQGPPM